MLALTSHAQERMQQRGIDYWALVLVWVFGSVQHCREGQSICLNGSDFQKMSVLFRTPFERLSRKQRDNLCAVAELLGHPMSAPELCALQSELRQYIKRHESKLRKLYLVLSSDGEIITVAYRS